jgi:hypothetical protein
MKPRLNPYVAAPELTKLLIDFGNRWVSRAPVRE